MDLEELADRLEHAAERVGPELDRTVQRQGRLLRALIRGNASGRPGPNIITGQYWRSWQVEPFPVPDGGGTEVGTDRPQGRRLEFGFYGMTDSLGRTYWQPPYPHAGPAVNAISPRFQEAVREALDDIFGGA